MCESLGRKDDARRWYDEGLAAAKAKGDSHALSELQAARNAVGE